MFDALFEWLDHDHGNISVSSVEQGNKGTEAEKAQSMDVPAVPSADAARGTQGTEREQDIELIFNGLSENEYRAQFLAAKPRISAADVLMRCPNGHVSRAAYLKALADIEGTQD